LRRPGTTHYAARVTPRELFEINGDFTSSPLIRTARRLHALFEAAGVPYAIVGGMAVARNGALRTTHDIDILTEREGWARIRASAGDAIETQPDAARDVETNIHVDVLFAGDDWGMVFPLPDPAGVSELDPALGARFMDLLHLVELKCAVYLARRREDGLEVAAKDLSDVVELVRHNRDRVSHAAADAMHPAVRRVLRGVFRGVARAERRQRH
jgi:hypothetical protein